MNKGRNIWGKQQYSGGVNQDELNALAATIPIGRIGDTSDIAGCLAYILSAGYVTGQTLSPNGGFVLQ